MYHLKVHKNQGIKRRQNNDMDAAVPTTEYQSIKTQQLNPSWLNQRHGMIKLILRFPTMWHFDMCRPGRASAASF